MRFTFAVATFVVILVATPASASEDYELYDRAGAAISGFVPSGSYAWDEFASSLDLDLGEQLAYRELQLAWLRTDLDRNVPSRAARIAAHIAVLDRFVGHLDAKSLRAFRAWIQNPATVHLGPRRSTDTVPPELDTVLAAFRVTLLGSPAV